MACSRAVLSEFHLKVSEERHSYADHIPGSPDSDLDTFRYK